MSTRQKVFSVLFGGARPWDVVFNLFILVLVLLNVSFLVASSVEEVAAANATLFFVAEAISVGIFTVEYLLRLWTCVEKLKLGRLGPVLGRLRFMVTFAAVVDFISIVPFYVFLIVNASGNSASGAQFFSAVRILRIFRLLKLDRLTKAFKLLKLAIFRTAEILFVTLLMELILFLFVATLLWILEPKLFPSIPSAMFVGLLMLTGSDFPVK
jgi:voltage-gated potassium channel